MIRELDTRTIYGNGGRVVWSFGPDASHNVAVFDNEQNVVSVLSDLEPAEAAVAFWHTFADPRVPDIFARTPGEYEAEGLEADDGDAPSCKSCGGPLLEGEIHDCLRHVTEREQRLLDDINGA